jgi:hypothetical protein
VEGRVVQGRIADLVALPSVGVGAPVEWLRRRLATTPGRIALASALILVGAVVFGIVASVTERSRQDAAHAVATETEPLLVHAVGLYASLSDADATAATTFLTGGLEPAARRSRYLGDLQTASRQLTVLAREVSGSETARAAVSTIAEQLPIYSGLVESARADNHLGLPLGAAYLRQASGLLRDRILPSAARLYELEAGRLNDGYRAGTGTWSLFGFLLVAAALILPVALAQVYLARTTHRVFNIPLLASSALLAALWIWGAVALVGEQNALARAQRNGSDPVEVLSAIQVLALRAQSDESLALIARGGGKANLDDFHAVVGALGGVHGTRSGLLGEAATLASRTGSGRSIAALTGMMTSYLAAHARTVSLEDGNHFAGALAYALRIEAPLADRLNARLGSEIAGAQRQFDRARSDATGAVRGLWLAIPVVAVLCAALALLGLEQRIREYR